jgi:Uma2 family endonuclease
MQGRPEEPDMPPALATHASGQERRTLRALADELLEEQRVEYIDDGVLTIMPPAGFTHARILNRISRSFGRAFDNDHTSVDWELRSENFQFDLVDDPQKFFVPDLAIAYPDSASNREFRENLEMVVEVTSPDSPKTVANDRGVKAKQYAKARIPCYLLVDQADRSWTLFVLNGDWPGYQIHSNGKYGVPIKLPEPFGFELPTDAWPPYSEES